VAEQHLPRDEPCRDRGRRRLHIATRPPSRHANSTRRVAIVGDGGSTSRHGCLRGLLRHRHGSVGAVSRFWVRGYQDRDTAGSTRHGRGCGGAIPGARLPGPRHGGATRHRRVAVSRFRVRGYHDRDTAGPTRHGRGAVARSCASEASVRDTADVAPPTTSAASWPVVNPHPTPRPEPAERCEQPWRPAPGRS
jgi:hypothetical protein